ncbi:Gfo/Idh/MocA family oxidoreductase [Pseudomaricurvus alkylphenolicus]|uniref:Gfo/Idh/MocA family protein n=1 Tax=Pseudomaricurvus alkylphenolicus TaxID=1306991 RepID=UPI001420FCE6|nr:Gfo/Idh/MocA family oxidoreductase [Pseudomaricurvus alkylphenolicus]NIB40029.1 Gfo/Idh/MocA family oxidoreductase [Pseudomaricurvus alkylphenolicus]
MKDSALKLGFIGGGLNSAIGYTHKIAAQMDNRWELVSGCFSRDPEVSRDTGINWALNENRIFHDWREFLARERGKLDAVAVLTPIFSHTEVILQALEAGYHVISEKPLTGTAEQAHAIAEMAQTHNRFVGVTYNYTGYPMLRELQSMIKEGRLGRIHQINIHTPLEGYLKLDSQDHAIVPQKWRLEDSAKAPTISLDLGTHAFHMVNFLTGETPLETISTMQSCGNFRGVIDNVSAIVEYSNQLHCNIWYSKAALGHSNGLRIWIYGDKGSAEWFQMEPEYLIFNEQHGRRLILDRANPDVRIANQNRYTRFKAGHPAGFIEAFANYYADLADSLIRFTEGNSPYCDFVQPLSVSEDILRTMEAMERSTHSRTWEKVR